MSLLGVDLGGTKLALAVLDEQGHTRFKDKAALNGRRGKEIGELIRAKISEAIQQARHSGSDIKSIGISVPGIGKEGSVWAPNLPEWENYPLLGEVKEVCGDIPVIIDSDRSCYILGEQWQGNAQGCNNAIFLAVGTGIGAGILVNGAVLHGSSGAAGAIGWMALNRPYKPDYTRCGCFEHYASGEGIANLAKNLLKEDESYTGELSEKVPVTAPDVFGAFQRGDRLAASVLDHCIAYWGMAIANLVSIFNPEKIIVGGGVFGPALEFIPRIKAEAEKWGQPVSIHQYRLEGSALGDAAGVYGAAYLALKNLGGIIN